MTAYDTILRWLQGHLLSCPSKSLFGIDCPGCGLQRSLIELLKGDFAASWHVYPPGIFALATLMVLLLHLIFKFRNGAVILKYMYIVTAAVITVNYIYKINTHQLI
ncbi:MAG: DUF2752 domain-containing protein [Bacteroidetes bacterium]|nr:DUF2752 domain-containing protein [Bacteroidota bacterium]